MNMDKDIRVAEEKLEYLSGDPVTQELYFERERALHEKANLINTGIRKGIEQGIQQGIQQGIVSNKIETAKNLLDILDDETISIKLGLDINIVKKLRHENMN